MRFNGASTATAIPPSTIRAREFPMPPWAWTPVASACACPATCCTRRKSLEGVVRPLLTGPGTTHIPHAPDSKTRFGLRDSYPDQEDYSMINRGESTTRRQPDGVRQHRRPPEQLRNHRRQQHPRRQPGRYRQQPGTPARRPPHLFRRGRPARQLRHRPARHDWTLSANRLHERLGMVYAFTGMQPGNLYQTSPHTPLPDFSSPRREHSEDQ